MKFLYNFKTERFQEVMKNRFSEESKSKLELLYDQLVGIIKNTCRKYDKKNNGI